MSVIVVSHSNLSTLFHNLRWYYNAFKYGGSRAQSGQVNGIANIHLSQQEVSRF